MPIEADVPTFQPFTPPPEPQRAPTIEHQLTAEDRDLAAGAKVSETTAYYYRRGQSVDAESRKRIHEFEHPPLTHERVCAMIAKRVGKPLSFILALYVDASKVPWDPVLHQRIVEVVADLSVEFGFQFAPPHWVPGQAPQPAASRVDHAQLQFRPVDASTARPIDARRSPASAPAPVPDPAVTP
jgi:hypothetical protein